MQKGYGKKPCPFMLFGSDSLTKEIGYCIVILRTVSVYAI